GYTCRGKEEFDLLVGRTLPPGSTTEERLAHIRETDRRGENPGVMYYSYAYQTLSLRTVIFSYLA
ncbi:unnamed protein product, partial [Amoebophrya sp. A25]